MCDRNTCVTDDVKTVTGDLQIKTILNSYGGTYWINKPEN